MTSNIKDSLSIFFLHLKHSFLVETPSMNIFQLSWHFANVNDLNFFRIYCVIAFYHRFIESLKRSVN